MITFLEYRLHFYFSGAIVEIIVYRQKQVAKQDIRSSNKFKIIILSAEWEEVASLFNKEDILISVNSKYRI